MTTPGLLLILGLMYLHYFADYTFQPESIHNDKPVSLKALALHALTYAGVISFGSLIILIPCSSFWSVPKVLIFALVNGVSHLVIDYLSSRAIAHLKREGRDHDAWRAHGLEQFFEGAALLTSYHLILGV